MVALNKKLCQKQNEILKLKTDFQKMKRRNGILEEENILRKRPEDKSTEKKNEVRNVRGLERGPTSDSDGEIGDPIFN